MIPKGLDNFKTRIKSVYYIIKRQVRFLEFDSLINARKEEEEEGVHLGEREREREREIGGIDR